MEKLISIATIIDYRNETKCNILLDDTNFNNFCDQLVFIYAILHYLSILKDKTIIHNDFKFDNLMLREVSSESNFYIHSINNENYTIPFIKHNDKKYKLVLIDYGASYINGITDDFVVKFKYNIEEKGIDYKNFLLIDILNFSIICKNSVLIEKLKEIITTNNRYLDIFNITKDTLVK